MPKSPAAQASGRARGALPSGVPMTVADHMPTARPFTGMTLDRVGSERKDPDWVKAQLARPDTRVVAGGPDGVLMTDAGPAQLLRIKVDREQLHDLVLL